MSGSPILSPNSKGNQTVEIATEQFGMYIHIPYCLQRCTYCDFATYVHTEIIPSEKYVELVKQEMAFGSKYFSPRKLDTIYFGGGTPSLIPAEQITGLIQEIKKHDFTITPDTEITIEINPATVDERKLNHYLEHGVNRFSVGAQSFSDRLLKMVHREHNAAQTLETLRLLESYKLNYSFDILFALPTQTLEELEYDLSVASGMGMSHVSPYCLTVPEGHPLSKNRPLDVDQIEMFEMIHKMLVAKNFHRYEISNYAQPGKESRHNLLYWTDQPYWGLGLSAHSYSKESDWGTRFWNASNINIYEKNILKAGESEKLEYHESLTDFCYTSLRLEKGLFKSRLLAKFGTKALDAIEQIARPLVDQGLMKLLDNSWSLTDKGVFISNQIYEKFTFLKSDFS